MFKNNEEETENEDYQADSVETIIGSSVKLEGDLLGEGNINVHGEILGKIQTKGDVIIGKSANVKADVNATNITVSGSVEGNIKSEQKLEITEGGRILGDISSKSLSISPGANFSGQCNMQNTQDLSEKENSAAEKDNEENED